ncbi:hypothetical protein Vretifemale_18491 [Volvox reticuliferus]|nr:hypothetical protein Vretifemale_18491 [Volvox reticuliferus]
MSVHVRHVGDLPTYIEAWTAIQLHGKEPSTSLAAHQKEMEAVRRLSSVVRGSMALVWPRPNMGNASVSLNLTGALDQITMAHIRLNATDTPIRLDLLPRYPDTAPVPLNPPLSFRGIMGFTVPFDYLRVGAWDPDNDHMSFIQALQEGLLYVSVQTAAMPGGALQGKLECQSPCMFSIGGGVVYAGR